MKFFKMIGYIAAEDALSQGFTHHGKYYGIPIWLEPGNPDFPIAAKWAPMECAISTAIFFEQLIRPIIFPDDEPAFQIALGAPIEQPSKDVKKGE